MRTWDGVQDRGVEATIHHAASSAARARAAEQPALQEAAAHARRSSVELPGRLDALGDDVHAQRSGPARRRWRTSAAPRGSSSMSAMNSRSIFRMSTGSRAR